MNLDFQQAENHLNAEFDPNVIALYEHHSSFLKAIIYQTDRSYQAFQEKTQWASEYIDARERNKFSSAFLAEIYLERALVYGMKGENLAAGNALVKCHRQLKLQRRRYPHIHFQYRISGLLKIAMSAVPNSYKWITDLIGLKGDFENGMRELKLGAEHGEFLRLETQLGLYYIERNLMMNPYVAGARIDSLIELHPGVLLLAYTKVNNALDLHDSRAARKAMLNWCGTAAPDPVPRFPFMNYAAGRIFLYDAQYELAIQQFNTFLRFNKGRLYRQDALFKLALAQWFAERKNDAAVTFGALLQERASGFDEDDYAYETAARYLKNGISAIEAQLLEARFAFDGGHFGTCEEVLEQLRFMEFSMSRDQRTELHYRFGRLYQHTGLPAKAKKHYALATKFVTRRAEWMQAYAMLYTGQIFEEAADWHEARRYYRAALEYDDYPYQNGLEQRAHAGLARLGKLEYEEVRPEPGN